MRMNFRLYNTMSKRIEPFQPADPGRVTFYTCGPTVYDDAHIGNFRSFLAADLLRRWLESPLCTLAGPEGSPEHRGPREVVHVMNITDVGHMTDDSDADGGGEDKMIAAASRIREAKKAGKLPENASVDPDDPRAVAGFYRARFLEDARALGLKVAVEAERDPTLMPSATEHVAGMQRVIARLLDEGAAYTAGRPGARAVYFDVASFGDYGRLSGNTLDRLRGGAGGRVDEATQQEKRHPADFLLWKEDPTHKMKWDAPEHPALEGWARGYPGWHIECTAMALERLVPGGLGNAEGAQIDLHSGGEDNIFPHHECEIAQSCAFTGAPGFARHWFHPRFLMVNGQKMSKSKGTFFTPRDLMAKGHDPAAIRLELIKTHYRANADFSLQGLKDSARMIERWRQARYEFARRAPYFINRDLRIIENFFHQGIFLALSNDLNISGAIGHINNFISQFMKFDCCNIPEISDRQIESCWRTQMPRIGSVRSDGLACLPWDRDCPDLFQYIEPILGVLSLESIKSQDTGIAVYLPGTTPSDEVETLLAERRDAKKAKDFARSDAIRDQLAAMGYAIKDMPGGKVEVGPK